MKLGSLYSQAILANNSVQNLISAFPKVYKGFADMDGIDDKGKPNTKQSVGFKFQIVAEESITLQSEVTDYYAEDNSSMNDHIALKPIKFTVSGFVGELQSNIDSNQELAEAIADKLTSISAYTPGLSLIAQKALAIAKQSYAVAKSFSKISNNYLGKNGLFSTAQTEQEKAFTTLFILWKGRTLFWVDTPFGTFDNMVIENLTATQLQDSKMISDFSVTFKQLKFAKTVGIDDSIKWQNVSKSPRIDGVSTSANKGDVGTAIS